jgi:hypothetical protein
MTRKYQLLFILFISGMIQISAFDSSDPLSQIGLTLHDLFESSRIPDEVFPNRGVEEREDNVVFYYSEGVYFFLYENRVWQVRYDRYFSETFYTLKLGMSRTQVLSNSLEKELLPLVSGEDYLTFQISDSPYPVRMKLYFVDELLDDFYLYRADF